MTELSMREKPHKLWKVRKKTAYPSLIIRSKTAIDASIQEYNSKKISRIRQGTDRVTRK